MLRCSARQQLSFFFPKACTRTEMQLDVLNADGERRVVLSTDCTGIDAPLHALESMGVDVEYLSASEIDPKLQENILSHRKPPRHFVADIHDRDNRMISKRTSLYVAGFPCQPWSKYNAAPLGNSDTRSDVLKAGLKFIDDTRPHAFLLENVPRLKAMHDGAAFAQIMKRVDDIRDADGTSFYDVQWKVLSPHQYGYAQRRARIFIIGISRHCSAFRRGARFAWPCPPTRTADTPETDLQRCIDREPPCKTKQWLSPTEVQVVKRASTLFGQLTSEQKERIVVVDTGRARAGQELTRLRPGVCPTLHTFCFRLYVMNQARFICADEALKLQGFRDKSGLRGLSNTAKFKAIGNSMHVGLLARLLEQLMPFAAV